MKRWRVRTSGLLSTHGRVHGTCMGPGRQACQEASSRAYVYRHTWSRPASTPPSPPPHTRTHIHTHPPTHTHTLALTHSLTLTRSLSITCARPCTDAAIVTIRSSSRMRAETRSRPGLLPTTAAANTCHLPCQYSVVAFCLKEQEGPLVLIEYILFIGIKYASHRRGHSLTAHARLPCPRSTQSPIALFHHPTPSP